MIISKQQLTKKLMQIFIVFILALIFFVAPQNNISYAIFHNGGGFFIPELPDPDFPGFGGGGGGGGGGGSIGSTFTPSGVCDSSNQIGNVLSNLGNIGANIPGLQVPVSDAKTHALLKDLDKNAEESKYLLKVLCEKEYEHDVELQNAWREVIGEFVKTTDEFVLYGYNGNSTFLANQNIYYQVVEDQVLVTFLQEIRDSEIGDVAKRDTIKTLLKNRFQYRFPNTGETLAQEDIVNGLEDDFSRGGGFYTFQALDKAGATTLSTIDLAKAEFERRRSERLEFEREKLAWGRGFYSYELCSTENQLFSEYEEDRRNCRIVTPGALIQDQVSFVYGSALRQMELADEYNEWISKSTFVALNDILNLNGFAGFGSNNRRDSVSSTAISPEQAVGLLDEGSEETNNRLPTEFDYWLDAYDNPGEQFKRSLEDVFEDEPEYLEGIPNIGG